MTPRPSDEAREALRAARRRASADPVPEAGEYGKPAGAQEQRPGDVARDALRRRYGPGARRTGGVPRGRTRTELRTSTGPGT